MEGVLGVGWRVPGSGSKVVEDKKIVFDDES